MQSMKRRHFLAVSAAAGLSALAGETRAAQERAGGGSKQVLDLRRYTFTSPEKMKAFEDFAAAGMVPALNRQGVRPVGVFKMTKADNPQATFEAGDTSLELFVLLPHPSLESVTTLESRLAADAVYTKALAALTDAPKDAAYARYESSLLIAFDECPKVEAPTTAAARVFQLRVYESHNDERSRMKVRMFNEGGEIRIFRAAGMHPVFFGHAFAGVRLPNLTYLLSFENAEAMKAAWARFQAHPDWQKLRADPLYKDTVSNITNLVLRPAGGSQV